MYPHSGQLLGMLAECEERAHTLSRLRLHLRSLCKQKSGAMLWLMAIKAEAMLPAGSHRVQVKHQAFLQILRVHLSSMVLWFTLPPAILLPKFLLGARTSLVYPGPPMTPVYRHRLLFSFPTVPQPIWSMHVIMPQPIWSMHMIV